MSKRVVAIGVFDGVHLGHQDLIRSARSIADARHLKLTALTFQPHPMSIVKAMPVELVSTLQQRKHWLLLAGADDVYVCDFTEEFSQQSADDFVTTILQATLEADVVVIGEGFRFGYKAAGTAETIRAHGLEVIEVAHTIYKHERISSTRIRTLVMQGMLNEVADMLGRNFEVEGVVVQGFQRGRELGFPTANVRYQNNVVLPRDGVYAGYMNLDHSRFAAAISLGYNSTFDADTRTLEVYALTPDWIDLYDQNVRIEFVTFIRDMQQYHGVEALIEAIEGDILSVKKALNLG